MFSFATGVSSRISSSVKDVYKRQQNSGTVIEIAVQRNGKPHGNQPVSYTHLAGDILLLLILLLLYIESKDEEFLIILIVVGMSLFKK